MAFPIGLRNTSQGMHFRVYASLAQKAEFVLMSQQDKLEYFELNPEGNGYFSSLLPNFKGFSNYYIRLDEGPLYPDPASNFQPEGPFGPSQIIDHGNFKWSDRAWQCKGIEEQIIYEMHIGTFTDEGTYAAAEKELPELAKLGVTALELMPLHDFPGKFGWGYDSVNLFAPTRLYGSPDELKSFIDAAHGLNLAVILDVVYNHFGPAGNFLGKFSADYFSSDPTDWGQGIDFTKEATREFFVTNACYWLELFHFDGLRFDALHALNYKNTSILKDIKNSIQKYESKRKIILIGEHDFQDATLIKAIENEGYGLNALWNDDFHHSTRVCLTGRREGYFRGYTGAAQEMISLIKHGFLYQGQYLAWQKKPRGSPSLRMPVSAFIICLQNHDQIANSPQSLRVHYLTDRNNFRAMSCLLLLAPNVPMLFQGQEFASSSPFYYFADHTDELMHSIYAGRKEFLTQFRTQATAEVQKNILNPADPAAFIKSKLNFTERDKHSHIYRFYKDLIKLRKTDAVFSRAKLGIEGAVLGPNALVLRYFGERHERLLLLNFSADLDLNPLSEPLLAAPFDKEWHVLFSSDALAYGGQGTAPFFESPIWMLPGHSCIVLA